MESSQALQSQSTSRACSHCFTYPQVLVAGGVRRGADVVKALALGARAVQLGRAYLYGLAAAGEPGVDRALALLRAETERVMALVGCPSVHDLDRTWLRGHDG